MHIKISVFDIVEIYQILFIRITGAGGYNTGVVNFQAPDMDDVKESVRQGVHKVAGRISSLANDVMSSLQDKYGY